jgi:hypothetical protein
MIEIIEPAYNNIQYAIQQYKTTEDEQIREHGFKASTKMLEGIGIFPSHSTSLVVNNIYQSITHNEIPKEIIELLRCRIEQPATSTIIDAEYDDV